MEFSPKSEFNDYHVQKHRRTAAARPDRLAEELSSLLQKITEDFEQPMDPRIALLKTRWAELAGKQIALHSEPQNIDRFILYVSVNHAGWMPELQKVKRPLLTRIQKAFTGKQPIRDIRFTLN